jgi:hypothetical protein
VDRVLDAAKATAIAVAPADGCPPAALAEAVGLLSAAGLDVYVIGDTPGLIVTRTVAMLANLAADAVACLVASETDIDTAMRLGVNYPVGPLAWARQWGMGAVLCILDSLENWYRDGRYRASPWLRRAALTDRAPAPPALRRALARPVRPLEQFPRREHRCPRDRRQVDRVARPRVHQRPAAQHHLRVADLFGPMRDAHRPDRGPRRRDQRRHQLVGHGPGELVPLQAEREGGRLRVTDADAEAARVAVGRLEHDEEPFLPVRPVVAPHLDPGDRDRHQARRIGVRHGSAPS